MTTAKLKGPQVTVAGEKYALSDVEAAIEVLENAAGIMVRRLQVLPARVVADPRGSLVAADHWVWAPGCTICAGGVAL
jgi:hypothetical protein